MKQEMEQSSRRIRTVPRLRSGRSDETEKRNHDKRWRRQAGLSPGVSGFEKQRSYANPRKRALIWGLALGWIVIVWLAGFVLPAESTLTSLKDRNLAPLWAHPFGTDWLGRDMFMRTLKGLTTSIQVGLLAACGGGIVALVLGLIAASGKLADRVVSWLIDLFLSVPHLVSLVMLAFVFGGGLPGVAAAIALTHWPNLARIVRAEMIQLKSADYIHISRRLGQSRFRIATQHMLPHLVPQLFVGTLLIFPHAILHEAAIVSGARAVASAAGHWHYFVRIDEISVRRHVVACLFPGLALLLVVRAFDVLGNSLKVLTGTGSSREGG